MIRDFKVLNNCRTLIEVNGLKQKCPEYQSTPNQELQILIPSPQLNTEARHRKIHDIRMSLRTLENATKNIREGYRFNDQYAELKIEAIESAVADLIFFGDLLEDIYAPAIPT